MDTVFDGTNGAALNFIAADADKTVTFVNLRSRILARLASGQRPSEADGLFFSGDLALGIGQRNAEGGEPEAVVWRVWELFHQ